MSVLTANPMLTTNAGDTFYTRSDGFMQGVAMDDPSARYALSSGTLSGTETMPLWGGVMVDELVSGASSAQRGTIIKRAATRAGMVGISVFNQAHNGLTTPQSPVPLFLSNMSVSFYRFGSGMRIPVKASSALINKASAGISVNYPVVWNFADDCLDVFSTAAADVDTTAITWTAPTASAAGYATATTATAHGLAVGAYVSITDAAPAAYNGTVQVLSVPDSTSFTFTPASVPAGDATTQGTVGAASQADAVLPVKIIELQQGNSKTVSYDPGTGFATWNDSGNAALILL